MGLRMRACVHARLVAGNSAERCLSNYLLFENSVHDPKMAAAVRLSEQLKNIDLEKMEELIEEDDADFEEGAEGEGEGEGEGEEEGEEEDGDVVDGGASSGGAGAAAPKP